MDVFKCTVFKKKITGTVIRVYCCILCAVLFSCNGPMPPETKKRVAPGKYKQVLEKINKYEIAKETDEINQYIVRHNWTMEKTGTGLRYLILEKGNGPQPNSGDMVLVNYKISLLDGTVCYSSEKDGAKDFKVEGDNVESGMHEAVLLMHVGERALFIIPSYIANGLQGDNDKIPPMSAILVDLELLAIK